MGRVKYLAIGFIFFCCLGATYASYFTKDSATNAALVVSYEHHEIHDGSHFFIVGHTDLANSADIDFAVQTPDSAKYSHMTFNVEGTQQVHIDIYEGATYNADGAAVTAYNSNRNSSTETTLTVKSEPTVTNAGTLIFAATNGASRTSGIINRDNELILKRNTKYLFRITNGSTSTNTVSYNVEWYEHTNAS